MNTEPESASPDTQNLPLGDSPTAPPDASPPLPLGKRAGFVTLSVVPTLYECQRCTACCRWPGDVRLADGEIARLAAFKGLGEVEFIQRFTRLTQDRRGLSLQEKPNGECIFLEGNDCSVQPVKPQQCRDFPNRWNFPGFEKVCQAIPRLVSAEEYEALVARAVQASPRDQMQPEQ